MRGTKADWRLTTLLEGYLKGNPGKGKTEQEKEEMRRHYKPGDDVLLPVQPAAEEDSEDERLLAGVREMSMANVDPETARRRAERAARHRRRQEAATTQQRLSPEELRRRQQPSRWASDEVQLTESRLRQHNASDPHIEHQPSLRSLLGAADSAEAQDVQAEILQSIYAEGLLDGLDLEHLTPEQEEELTDRIAQAYRRRQRHRDRSREHRHRESRSPQAVSASSETHNRGLSQGDDISTQQPQPRARPPVSRPHLFEQTLQEPSRDQRRSPSATSQRSHRSTARSDGASQAARSATDLSQQSSTEDAQRENRRRLSSNSRSVTDPENGNLREQIHRLRASSNSVRTESGAARQESAGAHPLEVVRRRTGPANGSTASLPTSPPPSSATAETFVRPVRSTAAFAPEAVDESWKSAAAPLIMCNRCDRQQIQYDLHYNCQWCLDGRFNLCLRCYREGQGCNHWFGFGFRAYDRWHRNSPPEGYPIEYERPHLLTPRRYLSDMNRTSHPGAHTTTLQEGAFCETCFTFSDDCYWYCTVCLEGAWGFCDNCVKRGRHCSHPLLLVAQRSTLQQPHQDPTKASVVGLPHLRPASYVALPVLTDCDICHGSIPPNSTRYHCYTCSDGDYDLCNECYRGLVTQGKISQANGPNGWRRCLQGHRMVLIGYQDALEGGHLRTTIRELVGGWAFKEDSLSMSGQPPPNGYPPDGGMGSKCLALYNYVPKDGIVDELAFPKNAEIKEVEEMQADWYWGVYAGTINLFPSNHVRVLSRAVEH